MKEITIKAPKEVLKVNFGEQSFSIPLGTSLPFDKMVKLSKAQGDERLQLMYELLMENIPEDIYKSLTMGEVAQILNAWTEETQNIGGMSPGE